jgi:hypothetical protein
MLAQKSSVCRLACVWGRRVSIPLLVRRGGREAAGVVAHAGDMACERPPRLRR